jgi:transcription elongation GreA/GreB family factor
MRERPIVVTELDARRLRELLARQSETSIRDQVHLQQLQSELETALVLTWVETPTDVVTMHSEVRVLDLESGDQGDYTLVFPLKRMSQRGESPCSHRWARPCLAFARATRSSG